MITLDGFVAIGIAPGLDRHNNPIPQTKNPPALRPEGSRSYPAPQQAGGRSEASISLDLRVAIPVVALAAEGGFAGPGALEVEARVVGVGHADAAVHLDHFVAH